MRTQAPQREFKGVWIPAFIWNSAELTWFQKCLLAEIDALDPEGDNPGCVAGNAHLAKMMGSTEGSIKDAIYTLRRDHWLIDRTFPTVQIRRLSVVKTEEMRKTLNTRTVSGHLPAGQQPLTEQSAATDQTTPPLYTTGTNRGTNEIPPAPKGERDNELIKVEKTEEELYNLYPKKIGKDKALIAIRKAIRKHGREKVLLGTRAFAETWKGATDFQFCPYPASFFNGEMYTALPEFWPKPRIERTNPRAELHQLEAKKDRHPCNPEYVKHNPRATDEQKAEYRALKARIKELEAIVG